MCEMYLKHSPDAKCGDCKYLDVERLPNNIFIDDKWYCNELQMYVNIHKLGCPDYTFCQKHYDVYQDSLKIFGYVDKVREVFEHTKDEPFMGGELRQVKAISDDVLFINSERRMDANMMATLRKHLDGRIICGAWENNILIIKVGCGNDE